MAKLTRYTQQVFGSSASANQMAQFGSLAAGSPLTYSGATITPAIVQQLSNYLTGWFGAVVGANSPAEEDMNAIMYLFAYQLAYGMQTGVPEWDAGTTYFKGSICTDTTGQGLMYVSLTDTNLNNPLTSTTNWKFMAGGRAFLPPTIQKFTSSSGTYSLSYMFQIASGNATAGATYTNNGITYTVVNTIAAGLSLQATGSGAPTASGTLTKATGTGDATLTFYTATSPLWLEVEAVGGGSGGNGGGTTQPVGSVGGNTTFGSSLITCNGGAVGAGGGGGAGGTATATGLNGIILGGQTGQNGAIDNTSTQSPAGTLGGISPFGGPGFGNNNTASGIAASGYGSGGGGGSYQRGAASPTAGGAGGSGGYVKVIIPNPAATYAYAVGGVGANGSAGTSGYAGTSGMSGIIIVREHYQ